MQKKDSDIVGVAKVTWQRRKIRSGKSNMAKKDSDIIGEVCLPDYEVEVGDVLDDGEHHVMAIDAVYLDHRGVVGGLCTNWIGYGKTRN
jgi:hypothetical protein